MKYVTALWNELIYKFRLSENEIDSKLTRNKKSFFGTTYAFGKTINTQLIGQLSKCYTNGNDNLTTKYRM